MNYILKTFGYQKIATYLNKKGIPTPSQIKNYKNAKQTSNWNTQHIARILNDRRYIGDYVGGYTEKLSFKAKKTRVKEEEEWIIIENHHEAIINKELFEKVQKIKQKRKKETDKCKNGFRIVDVEKNLYSGLLYCGRCGTPMYKRKGTSGKRKRPDSYICKKYSKEGSIKKDIRKNYGCISHRIRTEYLDKIVNSYIYSVIKTPEFKKFAIDNVKIINKESLENNIKKTNSELDELQRTYKKIYEDKLNNLIPDFLFKDKKQELDKKIKCEEEKIKENQSKLNKLENKEKIIVKIIEDIKKNGLKKEELLMLFDKIVFFEKNEITKEEKDLYKLSDMMYNEFAKNGGLAFHLKFMYP